MASPLARKMARDGGIDIVSVVGSGPNGRVISVDISSGARRAVQPAASATSAASAAFPHSGIHFLLIYICNFSYLKSYSSDLHL